MPHLLSFIQVRTLLAAQAAGRPTADISLDLGRTQTTVELTSEGVLLPGGLLLPWPEALRIEAHEQAVFRVTDEGWVEKVQVFSETFGRLYSLMPTAGAPTMLISGIPMHRIKGTDPMADTQTKIRAAAPKGRVLDTCTGLGYTAILAARRAQEVITIELDPAVIEICRINPWSRELFESPNITQLIGDSFDLITDFESASFDRVIHDPPMFNLAGQLYSTEFYREIHRVLKRGGRLFHYIGDLRSKSGRNVARSAARRLQDAGFRVVKRRPEAFGLLAFK
jgi:predicted methyltransferase